MRRASSVVSVRSLAVLTIASVLLALSALVVYADHNVNINTATVGELMTVPGIGKVLAERINEYRENERLFDTVDGLLNVKGVGNDTLEKIRDHVTVGDES